MEKERQGPKSNPPSAGGIGNLGKADGKMTPALAIERIQGDRDWAKTEFERTQSDFFDGVCQGLDTALEYLREVPFAPEYKRPRPIRVNVIIRSVSKGTFPPINENDCLEY